MTAEPAVGCSSRTPYFVWSSWSSAVVRVPSEMMDGWRADEVGDVVGRSMGLKQKKNNEQNGSDNII